MFSWKDYHSVALQLEGFAEASPHHEALLRSCVSRLYYGAFNTAAKSAIQKGFVRSGYGSDHASVRRHFQNRGKTLIAQNLRDLQLWREACDYHDEVRGITGIVHKAKKAAEEIYRAL